MTILNEEFKSQFLKKLNNNLKNDYKNDYINQETFIADSTILFKKVFSFALNVQKNNSYSKNECEILEKEIYEFKEKYNLSSSDVEYLNSFIGKDYYGRNSGKVKISNYYIKLAKDKLKKLVTGEYSDKSKIRTNETSHKDTELNDFRFIAKILKSIWRKDIANITDDNIKKIDKLPKLVTERSNLYNHFLFWFKSDNPDSNELLDTDKLVGISRGDRVYYPGIQGYGRNSYEYKVKDLSKQANKLFSILIPENDKEIYKKQNERKENSTIYRYELDKSNHYYSEPKIVDELPDPNSKNAPHYVKLDNNIYHLEVISNVISNNEFIRDYQYKELIKNQIKRYKTLAENVRLEKKSNIDEAFKKRVTDTVKQVHTYLYTLEQYKTSDLRNIYSKLDKMLSNYEQYINYKNYLMGSYSDYYKSSMNEYKSKTNVILDELLKIIKGA